MQASSYKNRPNRQVLRSNCNGIYLYGSADFLAQKWQEHSERLKLEGDFVSAERFGQQAEHYRRLASA